MNVDAEASKVRGRVGMSQVLVAEFQEKELWILRGYIVLSHTQPTYSTISQVMCRMVGGN